MNAITQKDTHNPSFKPYFSNFLIVNIFFWIVRARDWWHYFGFQPMNPSFADLRAFTAQVSCAQQGIDYLQVNCDPWNRAIGNLDIWVRIFQFLNINETSTEIVGNIFQILLILSIYSLAYAFRINLELRRNFILIILVSISPPIALLIERGQTEIIFFFLIIVSSFLVHSNRKFSAYLIIGFLSILKFYPIILLGLLLASRRIKNTTTQIIFGLLVLISSTGSIIYTLRGELNHTAYSPLSASLSEGYWRTFGVTVPPYLGIKTINDLNILESKIHFSRIQVQSFGFLIIVVVALILLFFHSRGKVFGPNVSLIIEEGTLRSIVLLFSLCLTCISYFLLSSYDYRMIYAVPLFLIGLAQESEKRKNKLIGYFVYGILFIMWAQIFIWTSALAQAPILVSFVLVLFNIRRALISDFLSFKGLKKSEILRF